MIVQFLHAHFIKMFWCCNFLQKEKEWSFLEKIPIHKKIYKHIENKQDTTRYRKTTPFLHIFEIKLLLGFSGINI